MPQKQSAVQAIDTNVIVRFLTADDPAQAPIARDVIAAGAVFVPATVILETEWVLRAGYRFSVPEIAAALRNLGGLAQVEFEDAATVAQAIDWMETGMDFADALHLARSSHCSAFVTFDRKLAQRAEGSDAIAVKLM